MKNYNKCIIFLCVESNYGGEGVLHSGLSSIQANTIILLFHVQSYWLNQIKLFSVIITSLKDRSHFQNKPKRANKFKVNNQAGARGRKL